MSYATRDGELGPNRVPAERDADTLYLEESRDIQTNIQSIQGLASIVLKLSTASSTASSSDICGIQRDIHRRMDAAKKLAVNTQSMLRNFGVITGGTFAEKTQRRLMHQKLSSDFQSALKTIERLARRHVMTAQSTAIAARRRDEFEDNLNSGVAYGADGGSALRGAVQSYYSDSLLSGSSTDTFPSAPTSTGIGSSAMFPSGSMETDAETHSYGDVTRGAGWDRTRTHLVRGSSKTSYINEGTTTSHTFMTGKDIQIQTGTQRCLVPIPVSSVDLEEEMLRERQAGIAQIQDDIKGIHVLYQELAFHVNCQGNDLDNIETQMRCTADHSAYAVQEVAAARTHRGRTYTLCWLLVAISLFLLVVVIMISYSRSSS